MAGGAGGGDPQAVGSVGGSLEVSPTPNVWTGSLSHICALVARGPECEAAPAAWGLLPLHPLSRPRSSDSCPKLKENPSSDVKGLSEQKKSTRGPVQTTSQTSAVECACC